MPTPLEVYPWRCFHLRSTARPLVDFHRHNEVELTLLRSGSLVYQMNGASVAVPRGSLCLFWGGIPHRWLAWSTELDMQVICLPMDFVIGLSLSSDFVHALLQGHLLTETNWKEDLLDGLLMEKWESDLEPLGSPLHAISRLEIEARLRRLALTMSSAKQSPSTGGDALSRLLGVLSSSATDGEKVEAMAAQAGLHPKYAMRLFKRECGIHMSEFLHQLRIGHAQRLLATGDLKVVDIAFESGFSSCTRFFEVFKELTGCSPDQYRKKIRSDQKT